jgi:hypothetical protein
MHRVLDKRKIIPYNIMSERELYCTEEQGERLFELVPNMFIVLDNSTRYPKLTKHELRHVMKHFNKDNFEHCPLMRQYEVEWWMHGNESASAFAEAIIAKLEALP